MIKKRLEKAKGKWLKELTSIFVGLSTILRKETNEMPYFLAFGFKVVGLPTIQTIAYNNNNQEVLARDLDLADKQRRNALV